MILNLNSRLKLVFLLYINLLINTASLPLLLHSSLLGGVICCIFTWRFGSFTLPKGGSGFLGKYLFA